jgi:hypothetical protein
MNPTNKRCVLWLSVCALAALLVSSGCKREGWLSASGTVTCDGQPIARGSISFEPADGKGPTGGGNIEAGKYEVSRVMAGKKIVRILAVRKTGRKVAPPMSGPSANATQDEIEQFLPSIHNTQSQLTAEIQAGSPNQIDFTLKSR